jgi:DNA-binding NarL/FixJ family response regulator
VIRVLVVDDHPSIVLGLQLLLDAETDVEVCGTARDGETGYQLVATTRPDLVLMDVSLPGASGIDATRRIVRDFPSTHVLILTWNVDDETHRAALEAGATASLIKDVDSPTLLAAIRACGAAVTGV